MRMQNIVNVILGTAFSAGASMAAIAAQPAASAGDRPLSRYGLNNLPNRRDLAA